MRIIRSHPFQPHRPMPVVPAGGFGNVVDQTAATRATFAAPVSHAGYAMFSNGRGRAAPVRRRRRRKTKAATVRKARRAAAPRRKRSRRARLVKGSAAAKRFMARLRAKRRRR